LRYNLPNSKAKITAKIYRDKNRKRRRGYCNNYRIKNPSGIYDVIKRGAKLRGIVVSTDRADFIKWYNLQERICHYQLQSHAMIMATI
jgi:hypothetical protein